MAEFMDFANAIQDESADIAGTLQGLYKNQEAQKMALNFGQQKEAMKQFAIESGMPNGYERLIDMAKTPEDVALRAREIVNYNSQRESFGRISGTLEGVSSIDDTLIREQVMQDLGYSSEDLKDPFNIARVDDVVSKKIQSARTGKVASGVQTLDEAKGVSSLMGDYGTKPSDPTKMLRLQLEDKNRQSLRDNQARSLALSEVEKVLGKEKKNLEQLNQSMPEIQGIGNSINEINVDDLGESSSFKLFGMLGLPQNKIGDAINKMDGGEKIGPERVAKIKELQNKINLFMRSYLKSMSGATVSQQEADAYNMLFGRGVFSRDDEWLRTVKNLTEQAIRKTENLISKGSSVTGGYRGYESNVNSKDVFEDVYGRNLRISLDELKSVYSIVDTALDGYSQINTRANNNQRPAGKSEEPEGFTQMSEDELQEWLSKPQGTR